MKAQFNELCKVCNEMITAGKDEIIKGKNNNWIHVKCSVKM